MKMNRAILNIEFEVPKTFGSVQMKGAKGEVKKNTFCNKKDYPLLFIPYAKGKFGEIELTVKESDLKFY